MTREECEKKIAELAVAMRNTLLEYNPKADYLHIFIGKGTNGNGKGDWDTYYASGNNGYYEEEEHRPIHFNAWKDIKDEKYWECISKEEDEAEERNTPFERLSDGSYLVHYSISKLGKREREKGTE